MPAGLLAVPDDSIETPSAPLPSLEVKPVRRRPDDADLVAQNLVARCARHEQDPCAPLPEITLFSAGLNPPTVAFAEPSRMPCCVLPWPARSDRVWSGQRSAGVLVDRIGQIGADEVALDQVADVGGIGNRDADAEALDGQAANDAVRGVEDEARSIRRCGCRR